MDSDRNEGGEGKIWNMEVNDGIGTTHDVKEIFSTPWYYNIII